MTTVIPDPISRSGSPPPQGVVRMSCPVISGRGWTMKARLTTALLCLTALPTALQAACPPIEILTKAEADKMVHDGFRGSAPTWSGTSARSSIDEASYPRGIYRVGFINSKYNRWRFDAVKSGSTTRETGDFPNFRGWVGLCPVDQPSTPVRVLVSGLPGPRREAVVSRIRARIFAAAGMRRVAILRFHRSFGHFLGEASPWLPFRAQTGTGSGISSRKLRESPAVRCIGVG